MQAQQTIVNRRLGRKGQKTIGLAVLKEPAPKVLSRAWKINLIRAMLARLELICQDSRDWREYTALVNQTERSNRADLQGLSWHSSAQLFAVQNVLRYVHHPPKYSGPVPAPDPADYFFTRKDLYAGYAIFKAFEQQIRAEFPAEEVRAYFDVIDYAEMNKEGQ